MWDVIGFDVGPGTLHEVSLASDLVDFAIGVGPGLGCPYHQIA